MHLDLNHGNVLGIQKISANKYPFLPSLLSHGRHHQLFLCSLVFVASPSSTAPFLWTFKRALVSTLQSLKFPGTAHTSSFCPSCPLPWQLDSLKELSNNSHHLQIILAPFSFHPHFSSSKLLLNSSETSVVLKSVDTPQPSSWPFSSLQHTHLLGVLVSCGHCNKLPQTDGLKQRIYSLAVLEVRSQKSRCGRPALSLEAVGEGRSVLCLFSSCGCRHSLTCGLFNLCFHGHISSFSSLSQISLCFSFIRTYFWIEGLLG